MNTDLITRQEAADILGVTVRTVRRYAVAGRLAIARDNLTGRVYYHRGEVMDLRALAETG